MPVVGKSLVEVRAVGPRASMNDWGRGCITGARGSRAAADEALSERLARREDREPSSMMMSSNVPQVECLGGRRRGRRGRDSRMLGLLPSLRPSDWQAPCASSSELASPERDWASYENGPRNTSGLLIAFVVWETRVGITRTWNGLPWLPREAAAAAVAASSARFAHLERRNMLFNTESGSRI